jgi:hypothetical protein
MDESRQVYSELPGIDTWHMYDLLCSAVQAACLSRCSYSGAHWVMDLEWYKAVRRAFLPAGADAEARDEAKWEPQPGDMVLGYEIIVLRDGGAPYLEVLA